MVALLFALLSGHRFSSYYIFYSSLFFATVYVGSLRYVYERVTGVLLRAAGYHRRAILVGSGKHIEAVAHALTDSAHSPSSSPASSRSTRAPTTACARSGRSRTSPRCIERTDVDEVIIADPDFPARTARSSSSTSATAAG